MERPLGGAALSVVPYWSLDSPEDNQSPLNEMATIDKKSVLGVNTPVLSSQ